MWKHTVFSSCTTRWVRSFLLTMLCNHIVFMHVIYMYAEQSSVLHQPHSTTFPDAYIYNRVTPYSSVEYGAINIKVGIVENASEDSAASTTSDVPCLLIGRVVEGSVYFSAILNPVHLELFECVAISFWF